MHVNVEHTKCTSFTNKARMQCNLVLVHASRLMNLNDGMGYSRKVFAVVTVFSLHLGNL